MSDWHPKNVAELCEGEALTVVGTPHGNVRISKRCADTPTGLAFTAALVIAATEEGRRALLAG